MLFFSYLDFCLTSVCIYLYHDFYELLLNRYSTFNSAHFPLFGIKVMSHLFQFLTFAYTGSSKD